MAYEKKWWALIATGLTNLLITVDFTIVNTSLGPIEKTFHANVDILQWLLSGFGITFCALMIAAGRLGDLLGRRKILYIGAIGFGLASLGAGFAHSIHFLIAMRIVQGFFGAALLPCGMAITADAFPEHQRGRALSIYGSLIGIGLAIGPLLGSIIVSLLNWRWIFFVNIPIIFISLIIAFFVIRESRHPEDSKIDWLGVVFLVTFLATLTFGINQGGVYGWDSKFIMLDFSACILSLIALIITEKNITTPLLPMHLFKNDGFVLGVLIYIVTIALAWVVLFLMPLYLHQVLGFNTAKVGVFLAFLTMMTVITPPVSGYLFDKKSKMLVSHSAFLFTTLSLLLFLFLNVTGPVWLIIVSFILFGSSWGMGNGIGLPAVLSSLKNTNDAGTVAGAASTALNMFGVIALTIGTSLFHYKQTALITNNVSAALAFMGSLHFVMFLLLVTAALLWLVASFYIYRLFAR